MDEHKSHCGVWDWTHGERTLNNAKPCTCGFREEMEAWRRDERTLREHGVTPLGMSEEDFLRTLRIQP